jgi:hypothetical protein
MPVPEDRRCTAKAKSTQERCGLRAEPGFKVCRYHGGKSLVGPAAPNYKHGGYSRVMPTRMLQRYEEAENDPELLSHRTAIALTDSRIVDLLRRVDVGESGQLWRDLRDTWTAFRQTSDEDERKFHLQNLHSLITKGASDWQVWHEVFDLLEKLRRHKDSEQKRLFAMEQIVTVDEAMAYGAALSQAVRRHVKDADTLRAIADDLMIVQVNPVSLNHKYAQQARAARR